MIEFIKNILNNNHLMISVFLIIIFSLSLLAIKNVRKIIIGSTVSIAFSLLLTLTARLSDTVMSFYRNLASSFGSRGEVQMLVSIEKDMAVAYLTIEKDCNLDIVEIFNYFNASYVFDLFELSSLNISKKKENDEILYTEGFRKNKINMSKYSFSFRV